MVFFHGAKSTRIDPSLHAVMKSIGAYATLMAKKQIMLGDWFEAMAEKNIHTEIPSCTQYIPNLTLDGMVIKMVDINLIQNFLEGYTFILGSSDKVVYYSFSVERKKIIKYFIVD